MFRKELWKKLEGAFHWQRHSAVRSVLRMTLEQALERSAPPVLAVLTFPSLDTFFRISSSIYDASSFIPDPSSRYFVN